MQAARRLYLYVMSGITLSVVAWGLVLLARVLLKDVFPAPDYSYDYEFDSSRQQLSQAIAMLAVGTPVWAVHWWLVQRGLAPGRPGRDEERGAGIRAIYITGVLLVGLVVWVSSAVGLLQWLADELLNIRLEYSYRDPLGSSTVGVVAFVIWLYHGLVRRRDLRAGPVSGPAAWIPRLYLYGVAVGALFVLLSGVGDFIVQLAWADGFGSDDAYQRASLVERVLNGVAWGLVWLGHWRYASRVNADAGWRGAEERVSRMRIAAFVIVIVGAAAQTLTAVTDAVRGIAWLVAGPPSLGDWDARTIAVPLLAALPWAAAWLLHTRSLRREPAAADPLRARHQERLVSHGVAAVALAIGAAGAASFIANLIALVSGGQRGPFDPDPAIWSPLRWLPVALVGLAAWAWFWRGILRRRRLDPEGEAASTIRRTSLYLTFGVALVVAIGAAAWILYRVVGLVVGADAYGNALAELSTPIGSLTVAVIVLAYHGLALRADQVVVARAGAAQPSTASLVDVTPRTEIRLTLRVPTDADPGQAVAALQAALPAGTELTVNDA
jgi:hypothetical protein